VKNLNVSARYEELTSEIDRALAFMVACGVDDDAISTVDFYASMRPCCSTTSTR